MHVSNELTMLFSHIIFLSKLVSQSYGISIQVRFNLIMQHAHSSYSGLADLYTHAVNACFIASSYTYHTSLSPVTIHLYINA